jgi:hypothetical protein
LERSVNPTPEALDSEGTVATAHARGRYHAAKR